MSKQTALEAKVEQNTKDIDGINHTMQEMLKAMNGLRDDMAKRGEIMLNALNGQNSLLVKNQTDHEVSDVIRFSAIKTEMAYYIGGGMGICTLISILIAAGDLYLRGHP